MGLIKLFKMRCRVMFEFQGFQLVRVDESLKLVLLFIKLYNFE